jgi:hypothetical protein
VRIIKRCSKFWYFLILTVYKQNFDFKQFFGLELKVKTTYNEIDFVRELAETWKDKESSFDFYGKFIGHSHPLYNDWKKFDKGLNKKYCDAYWISNRILFYEIL